MRGNAKEGGPGFFGFPMPGGGDTCAKKKVGGVSRPRTATARASFVIETVSLGSKLFKAGQRGETGLMGRVRVIFWGSSMCD